MRIADVDLWEKVIERPHMLPRSPTVHHDDERALSAEKIDEELKKGVNGEGLVDVTYRIEKLSGCEGDQRHPRRYGVDRDHEQDAHDIALEQRFAIVFSASRSATRHRRLWTARTVGTIWTCSPRVSAYVMDNGLGAIQARQHGGDQRRHAGENDEICS